MAQEDLFEKIVAHAKEYGFVFRSSEILRRFVGCLRLRTEWR